MVKRDIRQSFQTVFLDFFKISGLFVILPDNVEIDRSIKILTDILNIFLKKSRKLPHPKKIKFIMICGEYFLTVILYFFF